MLPLMSLGHQLDLSLPPSQPYPVFLVSIIRTNPVSPRQAQGWMRTTSRRKARTSRIQIYRRALTAERTRLTSNHTAREIYAVATLLPRPRAVGPHLMLTMTPHHRRVPPAGINSQYRPLQLSRPHPHPAANPPLPGRALLFGPISIWSNNKDSITSLSSTLCASKLINLMEQNTYACT